MGASFYHVCFAVPDLEQACADLTAAAGVSWQPARASTLADWEYRIVFTDGPPPYLEIIEGPPGSPWDATTSGPRFDHLGWWTRSIERSTHRLTDAGFPGEFSGCPFGRPFAYHRVTSIGARIEVVDVESQAGFLRIWDPDGVPGPALECRSAP